MTRLKNHASTRGSVHSDPHASVRIQPESGIRTAARNQTIQSEKLYQNILDIVPKCSAFSIRLQLTGTGKIDGSFINFYAHQWTETSLHECRTSSWKLIHNHWFSKHWIKIWSINFENTRQFHMSSRIVMELHSPSDRNGPRDAQVSGMDKCRGYINFADQTEL